MEERRGAGRVLLTTGLILLMYATNVNTECPTCTGECSKTNVDLVFVVDGSGSICEDQELGCQNWRNILQFVVNMVDHLTIAFDHDRVGLVQFSNDAVLEFPLTQYTNKPALQRAILNVNHRGGNTNTSGGIRLMRTKAFFSSGDRLEEHNIAMVITDGRSTRDPDRTIPEAKAAQDSGIYMYSLGVTPSVDANEIKQISSYPQQQNRTYFFIRNFDILSSYKVTDSIFTSICAEPQPGEGPLVDVTVSRCPGKVIGQDCYVIQESGTTWTSAETQCSKLASNMGQAGAGSLAMPKSQQVMSQLTAYLKEFRSGKTFVEQENLASFWIGGYEEGTQFGDPEYPVWRWLSGLTLLQDQGCFADSASSPDLSSRGTIYDLTREKCMSICTGYRYVGVQNGNLCSCGDTYGQSGTAEVCTTPCAGDSSTTCGGPQANQVLRIGGAYGLWATGQPNNYNDNQPCGALQSTEGGQWGLNDYTCYKQLSYICSLPLTSCSQTSAYHHLVDTLCLQLVTSELSWFKAREDCQSRGGDLVSVNRKALHAGIENLLSSVYSMTSPFWVGAVGRMWKWYDGEAMTYTHWSDNEPNEGSKACLKMAINSQDEVWWGDEACDSTLPYICHVDLSAVVTTTTTKSVVKLVNVVTTNIPTTTTTAPTTTSNGTEPDLGASTDIQGAIMSSAYYFLIGFGIVLLFIIVAIVVLIYMHKHKNVSPEKTPAAEPYVAPKFDYRPSLLAFESFHKVAPESVSEEPGRPQTESRWKKPRAMISYVHESGEKKQPKMLSVVGDMKKLKEGDKQPKLLSVVDEQKEQINDYGGNVTANVYEEIYPSEVEPVHKKHKKKRRKKLKAVTTDLLQSNRSDPKLVNAVNEAREKYHQEVNMSAFDEEQTPRHDPGISTTKTSSVLFPKKTSKNWGSLTKALPTRAEVDGRAEESSDNVFLN